MTDPGGGHAAIELRGISKSYGIGNDQQVRAADDVSLNIAVGAFVALTGASGSGKLHLAAPDRRYRAPGLWHDPLRRNGRHGVARRRAGGRTADCRFRVPALQPASGAHRVLTT